MTQAAPSPRSCDELRALVSAGAHLKYLHFWGHRPRRDGSLGSGCLSQWWPSPFHVDGIRYVTAEHYMMASKARLFGDETLVEQIATVQDPGAVKAIGRRIAAFDENIWRGHRFDIVVRGNAAKFGQHADLREFLLATRSRILVEASPVDRVWGIGLAADDPRAADPTSWRGLNLLGFALMQVRAALASAPTPLP